jgi:hypothetical protein
LKAVSQNPLRPYPESGAFHIRILVSFVLKLTKVLAKAFLPSKSEVENSHMQKKLQLRRDAKQMRSEDLLYCDIKVHLQ